MFTKVLVDASRVALVGASLFAAAVLVSAAPARAQQRTQPPVRFAHTIAFMATLHDGRIATIYTDGRVAIAPAAGAKPTARTMLAGPRAMLRTRPTLMRIEPLRYGLGTGDVRQFTRNRIIFDLEHPPKAYVPNRVIVVLKPGVASLHDVDQLDATTARTLRDAAIRGTRNVAVHAFTSDARTNAALFHIGVDRMQRLFTGTGTSAVGTLRARAEATLRTQLIPIENAYVVHVTAAPVRSAVKQLRALPTVAYAAPDRTVGSMLGAQVPIPASIMADMAAHRPSATPFGRTATAGNRATLPTNTSLAVSQQALLNAPGVDAAAAFDEIANRFDQLPGAGEIVTNVSVGDADDASAAEKPNDPCQQSVSSYGGTTHVIGGQRYLDWPGMPLIPVWLSDPSGKLSSTAEVCNVDPILGEVGLDFSMMAALPDAEQRASERAPAGADLLGIAPGATYRLVMPQGDGIGDIGESDMLGAFIGAATQIPAPNVITSSIGYGLDSLGFPSRYLEDDPLFESVIASIVNASNVVVCISANDGTRTYTVAPIGPSGGSAATNVPLPGTPTTTIDDVSYSTAPSVDLDSGAIDAGASTLDDVIAANPLNPRNASLAQTKAFAETRFDGMLAYSSGFGTRVSLSAPGDNVGAYMKGGTAYDATTAVITGGTSAAAPEIAAVAAIALQVARLTGHPIAHATDVRSLLQTTGTTVATPPNSDMPLNVGPQVSARRAIEQLLTAAGKPVTPGVGRVGIQGHNTFVGFSSYGRNFYDALYTTGLDPSFIRLDGPWQSGAPDSIYDGSDTGAALRSFITIAPDWEGIPANAQYRLYVTGHPSEVISSAPYARLLPAQLFSAAGIAMTPGTARTVALTYEATAGLRSIARTSFQLTFGPPAPASRVVFAPNAPAVVTGSSFQVSYDLTGYPMALAAGPRLNVSLPGETILVHQNAGLYPLFSTPLTGTSGTVTVPTSALAGAGTYTVWIDMRPNDPTAADDRSDAAFVRVAPSSGSTRPPAPLLAPSGSNVPGGHFADVPLAGKLQVSYDVSNVPGASGAIVELSALPPGWAFEVTPTIWNMFDNPNGDRVDDDGVDTGSVYHVATSGVRSTVTIDLDRAGVLPTNYVNVRVIPARGSAAAGEASDFSTFYYHGIDPLIPVPVESTIGNATGTDGGMAGAADIDPTTTETVLLQQFDLSTGAIVGLPLEGVAVKQFFPIVEHDLELAAVAPNPFGAAGSLYADVPFASAGMFTQPTYPQPPATAAVIPWSIAPESGSSSAAYLYYALPSYDPYVVRGDFATGQNFSSPIDVSAGITATDDLAYAQTFAYESSLDRAYFVTTPASGDCSSQHPALVTVDFGSGSVTRKPLSGLVAGWYGFYMMAVDASTHTGIVATTCQRPSDGSILSNLAFIDLRSGTLKAVVRRSYDVAQSSAHFSPLLVGDSPFVNVDPLHQLVLQTAVWCPQPLGQLDDHARPCVNEFSEDGTLVKTLHGVVPDGPPIWLPAGADYSARRIAAPSDESVSSFWLQYLAVEPYSY
ncbi:MAG TPA: S8 family serine peptidase [Candidatus Baltobacteraceae bacterium]|nr:S8 family serine peptidase [Candidatus Baltobacteraceae bacterium]